MGVEEGVEVGKVPAVREVEEGRVLLAGAPGILTEEEGEENGILLGQ